MVAISFWNESYALVKYGKYIKLEQLLIKMCGPVKATLGNDWNFYISYPFCFGVSLGGVLPVNVEGPT